ncbi:hypothetical protein IJI89_02520 [Candidatus Saccharibacteria bacterium]|nr:hypothetical protein [Candidatus Saccharibacteria bacterium]
MQPEEIMMRGYSGPKKEGNKFGLVIAMGIMLFIAAIAGVIFGVYEMMARNSEVEEAKAECAKAVEEAKGTGCTETKEVKTISKEVARSIIKPYIGTFNYLNTVFEYGLTDEAKIEIAYQNVRPTSITTTEAQGVISYKVAYSGLDEAYKRLFKLSTSVPKQNYAVSHGDTFEYTESSNEYIVKPFNGGGAGSGMFTVVKKADYTDDGLVVEVYHDVLPTCEAAADSKEEEDKEEQYCIEVSGSGIAESMDEYNVKVLIEKFTDEVPVYKMKFSYFDGHLVLDNISKS